MHFLVPILLLNSVLLPLIKKLKGAKDKKNESAGSKKLENERYKGQKISKQSTRSKSKKSIIPKYK